MRVAQIGGLRDQHDVAAGGKAGAQADRRADGGDDGQRELQQLADQASGAVDLLAPSARPPPVRTTARTSRS